MVVALLCSVGLVLLGPGTAGAVPPTWHTTAYPSVQGGGYNASTVYNGQLHVLTAIRTSTGTALGHDWWDGQRWNFEILDGSGSTWPGHTADNVGGANKNAVTVYGGQLQVFTYDATTSSLRHDWWDGSRWQFEVLDGSGSLYPGHTTDKVGIDIAVTVYAGQLQVYSHDASLGSLRHVWWDGRRWNFETLDGSGSAWSGHSTDNVGIATAVTVYSGRLHLFTGDATSGSLRHDWWDGRRWNFETLDGPGSTWPGHTAESVGWSNSVAVYGTQLHVFTSDSNATTGRSSLRQDWWDGAHWNFAILDQGNVCPPLVSCDEYGYGDNSVVAVFNGQLHVFSDEFTSTLGPAYLSPAYLLHDWWDGTRWNHQILLARPSYEATSSPANAVTVYNTQLHVFTFSGGLVDVWWG
jgi:hypothetical protein